MLFSFLLSFYKPLLLCLHSDYKSSQTLSCCPLRFCFPKLCSNKWEEKACNGHDHDCQGNGGRIQKIV